MWGNEIHKTRLIMLQLRHRILWCNNAQHECYQTHYSIKWQIYKYHFVSPMTPNSMALIGTLLTNKSNNYRVINSHCVSLHHKQLPWEQHTIQNNIHAFHNTTRNKPERYRRSITVTSYDLTTGGASSGKTRIPSSYKSPVHEGTDKWSSSLEISMFITRIFNVLFNIYIYINGEIGMYVCIYVCFTKSYENN